MNYGVYLNKLLIVIGCNANEIELSLKTKPSSKYFERFPNWRFYKLKNHGFHHNHIGNSIKPSKNQKLELKVLFKS
jgi:hypothetical protein